MRALALDIGQTRIGIAASDLTGTIASPVKVLPASEVLSHARSFTRILEDYEPEVLVCGRPRTLAGADGPQARRVMDQARAIAQACDLPLELVDERLSSAEAKRVLHSEGYSEKTMRGRVDMVAASLFLQTWLDARNQEGGGEPHGTD